jgi:hypothetical protein
MGMRCYAIEIFPAHDIEWADVLSALRMEKLRRLGYLGENLTPCWHRLAADEPTAVSCHRGDREDTVEFLKFARLPAKLLTDTHQLFHVAYTGLCCSARDEIVQFLDRHDLPPSMAARMNG